MAYINLADNLENEVSTVALRSALEAAAAIGRPEF